MDNNGSINDRHIYYFSTSDDALEALCDENIVPGDLFIVDSEQVVAVVGDETAWVVTAKAGRLSRVGDTDPLYLVNDRQAWSIAMLIAKFTAYRAGIDPSFDGFPEMD